MQIASGTVASFHYTLRGEDGAELENSRAGEPVAYLHGHGNILPALEEQLAGHAPGDTLAVTLAPEQAYGLRHADSIQRVPLKHIRAPGRRLAPGMVVAVETGHGARQVTRCSTCASRARRRLPTVTRTARVGIITDRSDEMRGLRTTAGR